MRAVDYRSPNLGIALVICKSFENERAAQQGLGRVGRNEDPCQRVQLKSIALIDEDQKSKYLSNLKYYFSHNIAKKFEVKQPVGRNTIKGKISTKKD